MVLSFIKYIQQESGAGTVGPLGIKFAYLIDAARVDFLDFGVLLSSISFSILGPQRST